MTCEELQWKLESSQSKGSAFLCASEKVDGVFMNINKYIYILSTLCIYLNHPYLSPCIPNSNLINTIPHPNLTLNAFLACLLLQIKKAETEYHRLLHVSSMSSLRMAIANR